MHLSLFSLLLSTTALATPLLPPNYPLINKNIILLPLGDSITYGVGDPKGDGYRGKLYNYLLNSGASNVDFVGSLNNGDFADTDNEGHVGYTISQIAGATNSITHLEPNIVLLHAGTNDAIKRYEPSDQAIRRLGLLVDQIFKEWPEATVIIAKLIPNSDSQTQLYINDINAGISRIVVDRVPKARKILSVDMSPPNLTTKDLVDGTHPGPEGYEKMADIWLKGLNTAGDKGWLVPKEEWHASPQ